MAQKFVFAWDDENHTCLRMELGMGWSWGEFIEAIDEAHAMVATKDHDVNLIMLWKASLPPGREAMPALQHAGGTQPPNLRHTVMVNKSTRFLDILIKNTDRREGWVGPKIVQNIDDARKYLGTLD